MHLGLYKSTHANCFLLNGTGQAPCACDTGSVSRRRLRGRGDGPGGEEQFERKKMKKETSVLFTKPDSLETRLAILPDQACGSSTWIT